MGVLDLRSPLPLVDRLLEGCARQLLQPSGIEPAKRLKIAKWLRNELVSAKRYFFEDEAAHVVETLGTQHPEVLVQMLRHARAPYRRVWLEWPIEAMMVASGQVHAPDAPDRAGVIIERLEGAASSYRMILLGIATAPFDHPNTVSVAPFCVVYDILGGALPVPPEETALVEKVIGLPLTLLRRSLAGSSYLHKLGADVAERELREQQCDALVSHATFALTPVVGEHYAEALMPHRTYSDRAEAVRHAIQNDFREYTGTWRFVMGALALLNERRYVDAESRRASGAGRRFVGGKSVAFLDHHVVKLSLPPATVVSEFTRHAAEAIPRRRHEVSGHYAHSRRYGDRLCQHVYAAETNTRDVCVLCNHKRWWVRDHLRGDANVGFASKEFRVGGGGP